MFEAKFSPSAERNKEAILAVLREFLPKRGNVLEIASGTGQHVMHFAKAMPELNWLPSEPDESYRVPLQNIIDQASLDNVAAPINLDVLEPWPHITVDAVIVANMLHISPVTTVQGLLAGAASVLVPGGIVHVYGPFKVAGECTSPSNQEFDQSLSARNEKWGIRDLEEVTLAAIESGLQCTSIKPMPANNFSLVYKKTS